MVIKKSGPLPVRQNRNSAVPEAPFRAQNAGRDPSREKTGCIRVLIVDSCSLGAIGIGEILRSKWKEATVSHARYWHEITELLVSGAWDLVLIELELADESGLDLVTRARTLSPGVRLLAMSSGEESVQGLQALRAGSAGFLHRGGTAEDLLKAVEQVLAGRHYVSRRLADTLARRVDTRAADQKDADRALTAREAEILEALAQGDSIKVIGPRFAISPKTVSSFRRRILEKMNFRNDADIVKYWWSKSAVALRP